MPVQSQSIREIAAKQPSALKIFERFEIDACSVSDKSLTEVCVDLHLSVDQIVDKLAEVRISESSSSELDSADLTLTQIIRHIVRTHHHRVRRNLPELARMAQKLARAKGERASGFDDVAQLIEHLHSEMLAHIRKEEEVLFPFIARMEEDCDLSYPAEHSCFRALSNPVFMMVQEHEAANQIMAALRGSTRDFEAPNRACTTHVALLAGLRDFEADLKQHVYIENEILFPKAMRLESQLKRRSA